MSDKIRKLSEAIRLGATFRPQCKKAYFAHHASCALGAALEAVHLRNKSIHREDAFLRRFPELRHSCPVKCPCGEKHHESSLYSIVTHLNDDAGWTREAIADWLESKGY